MMRQSDSEVEVISLNNNLLIDDLVFKRKYRHIYIYSTAVPNKIKMRVGKEHYIEYLDAYLIILPSNYTLQAIIWNDFYTYYGDIYESIIDVNNNIKCIAELYSYIQCEIHVRKTTNILDYGCGSGLSTEIISNCNLMGYEPNEKMRRQAADKGLEVFNTQQLKILPEGYIDAVFSSYVFHMGISDENIEMLSRIVHKDGIIVANYYKDINRNVVNDIFLQKGFEIRKVTGIDKRFGSVYEYQKR